MQTKGKQKQVGLSLATTETPQVIGIRPQIGRFFSDSDINFWSKVCVIGYKVFNDLFSQLNPLGQEMKIGNHRYTVVDVMAKQGKGIGSSGSRDNQVFYSPKIQPR